jgi:chemotaxis protein CheD
MLTHPHSLLSGNELERIALNINPGGWATDFERPISTLLGSCVAVCLYDPKLGLSGMNHFLLPTIKKTEASNDDIMLAGDFAMEVLVNAMLDKGASKTRMVAKAFGGGNVVGSLRIDIGDRNAQFAVEWLEREGIPLITSSFGGPWARKVVCVPATGDAFCRRTRITMNNRDAARTIVEAENSYELSLKVPKPGRVELF